jgi:predicted nucleotidyltransferase
MELVDQQEALTLITGRLIDYFQPERIYLFGSVARDAAGRDSDLDFCIVLANDAPAEFYGARARQALRGIPVAVDLIRWPATDFDRRAQHVAASLPATIVREGKLLYDSRAVTA